MTSECADNKRFQLPYIWNTIWLLWVFDKYPEPKLIYSVVIRSEYCIVRSFVPIVAVQSKRSGECLKSVLFGHIYQNFPLKCNQHSVVIVSAEAWRRDRCQKLFEFKLTRWTEWKIHNGLRERDRSTQFNITFGSLRFERNVDWIHLMAVLQPISMAIIWSILIHIVDERMDWRTKSFHSLRRKNYFNLQR